MPAASWRSARTGLVAILTTSSAAYFALWSCFLPPPELGPRALAELANRRVRVLVDSSWAPPWDVRVELAFEDEELRSTCPDLPEDLEVAANSVMLELVDGPRVTPGYWGGGSCRPVAQFEGSVPESDGGALHVEVRDSTEVIGVDLPMALRERRWRWLTPADGGIHAGTRCVIEHLPLDETPYDGGVTFEYYSEEYGAEFAVVPHVDGGSVSFDVPADAEPGWGRLWMPYSFTRPGVEECSNAVECSVTFTNAFEHALWGRIL